MKRSHLYTKTGDAGTTALVGGTRVPKTHVRLEAYGTIDELNAQLGYLVTYLTEAGDRAFVQRVQYTLFALGSYLATDQQQTQLKEASVVDLAAVEALEAEIDRVDEKIPPLHLFVIPGGDRGAALCHVCRTVCRRAERQVLLVAESDTVAPEVLAYLNRLSDYLFVLSRKLNINAGEEEFFWDNRCK